MTEYAAFLLKIWREPGQAGERIVLKDIHTGESVVLNSAESLLAHLSPPSQTDQGDSDDSISQSV